MIGRRTFLSGAATVGFVGCCCGVPRALAADVPLTRRVVRVGGRLVPVCDFHAHCVIPAVGELIKGTKLDRAMPKFMILAQDRLDAMNRRGIDVQLLSINIYWWYGADRELAAKIVRLHDEGLAALCAAHPGRFEALSSPALQFPDLAAEQLEYAVKTLGLKGASVGGHVNGEVPSGPAFDVFWARAAALGVPVFMHPNGAANVVREGGLKGRGDLENIIGDPLETTMFLDRMMFDGALDRTPGLQLVAAHGGGYLPLYLGRNEVACEVRRDADCVNRRHPAEYLRDQIMADVMVFSRDALRLMVSEMGARQLVYGSDMPFTWPDMIDEVLALDTVGDAEKEAILGGNFQRILRLS